MGSALGVPVWLQLLSKEPVLLLMDIPDLGNCLQGQGSCRGINLNQHGTLDCYFEVSELSQVTAALIKKRPLETEIPAPQKRDAAELLPIRKCK